MATNIAFCGFDTSRRLSRLTIFVRTVAERHTHTTYRWTLNLTRFDLNRFSGKWFDLNRFVGKRFDPTVSLVSDSILTQSILTYLFVSYSILTDSLVSDSILIDSLVSDSILSYNRFIGKGFTIRLQAIRSYIRFVGKRFSISLVSDSVSILS